MKPNRSIPVATVIPVLTYPNVNQAVAWLSAAFGFAERVRIGENHRAQLTFGDGALIAADVRGDRQPPRPGEAPHQVVVRVEDARAHCERARANGARIMMEPTDFEYGERQYQAEDPWGHQWIFSETVTSSVSVRERSPAGTPARGSSPSSRGIGSGVSGPRHLAMVF